MNELVEIEKILTRNAIKRFILRIDFMPSNNLVLSKIAENMAKKFDRTEKRQISNFTVSFTKGASEMSENKSFDYVLTSDTKSIAMTISEVQNALWLESSQYLNKSVYQCLIVELIRVIDSVSVESKRIGMRYINEFKCEKDKDIGRIFAKRLSTITKHMLKPSNQSRAIAIEEYTNDEQKLRIQYGVPNKFYPSKITLHDLVFDIDSYSEVAVKAGDWLSILTKLNHSAYEIFITEMNEKYVKEELK